MKYEDMRDLLAQIYTSPSCDEQETLSQVQASFIDGTYAGLSAQIEARQAIVSWLQRKGCDIEMDGTQSYMLNGVSYKWSDVSAIKEWLKCGSE